MSGSQLEEYCRSPIELSFLREVARVHWERGEKRHRVQATAGPRQTVVVDGLLYEMDFCITFGVVEGEVRATGRICIELDGHDWHERTKEQAARDRSRDRALLRAGIPTIRFTGAEVYGDVAACVAEVFKIVDAWAECTIPSVGIDVLTPKGFPVFL